MNILYIDHYAGSLSMGMEFRPFYFAREWKKAGHNVRLVGADFSHLRKVNPTVNNDFEIQEIDGIEFQWIKTRKYKNNGLARALTMLEFCGKLWTHSKKIVDDFKPDVIIASSTYPLDTFPAQKIKKCSDGKALLVHEVHDMWPITPIELYGMSKYHPFVVAMQIAENSFCKHSDLIASIPPCAADYFEEHGMDRDKFVCIQNGVVLEDWEAPIPLDCEISKVIDDAHASGKTVIGFYGSHTRSYCIDNLIKAIAKNGDRDVVLLFVGSGDYKEELMTLSKNLDVEEQCKFFDPISKQMIPSLIHKIDATYVGAMKNNMFRFGIGMNKLFDAMMGGKPILYAVEAPNNYITEYNCGITVAAEDVDALAIGIHKLIEMPENEKSEMGLRGHEAVIMHFNYGTLSNTFIEAIKKYQKLSKL